MDPVEQAIVLECLRLVRRALGFRTSEALAKELADSLSEEEAARDCILRRSISEDSRAKFSEAALSIIADRDNYEKIKAYYVKANSRVCNYLADIIFNCRDIDIADRQPIPPRDRVRKRYIDVIAQKWDISPRQGRKLLQTGLYQMYRRYKPPGDDTDATSGENKPDPMGHAIVAELIYVDWDSMECVGVTSEGNIYHGALSINHENILFGVLQRSTHQGGLNWRFIALHLEHRRLPMYSGLCIKVGDTTRRPLASDCLYVPIPLTDHGDLYTAFGSVAEKAWSGEAVQPIESENVISQYLTGHPPLTPYDAGDPAWRRVKFLRDFPEITELIIPNNGDTILFQEPSRTLSFDTLRRLSSRKAILPIFRWPEK